MLLSFLVGAGTTIFYKPGFDSLLQYTGGAAILLSGPFLVVGCGVFLPFRRWRKTALGWIGAAFLLFASGLLLNIAGVVIEDLKGNL